MKKIISMFLIILLIFPSLAMAGLQENQLPQDPEIPKVNLQFFEEVFYYITSRHPFEIEESALIEGGLKGMLQSVDPYSDYYTPDESYQIFKDIKGEFVGIGVYISEEDGYIKVVDLIPGESADLAGIEKDDIIVSIGDENIKGFGIEKSTSMIKGPKGTMVELGIKRGDKLINIKLPRKKIYINPIEYKILEDQTAYILMKEFTETGTKNLKKVLKELDEKNIENIILDLRNNPGGLLSEAINTCELFVPKGPIVHIREKDKALVTHLSSLEKVKYKLVVLVNENSASAAEILAGAVQDRKAGALVGSRSYGKGTVQNLVPLIDGGIIKLTIAEYLTPNKRSINGKGIEPDYQVENSLDEDLQLKKAREILK